MIYLLDTNAFSDLMKGHSKLDAKLAGLAQTERIAICSIVWGEIRYGIERLPQGQRRLALAAAAAAAALRPSIVCDSVPEAAGDHYATLKIFRQQHSIGAEENDLWIAATAVAIGATLVTRDKAMQQLQAGLPGLQVEDWTL